MTALIAEVDSRADDLVRQASSYGLLPAGRYQATIKAAEVVPFAKSGRYEGKNALSVQLRIIDGSPVGAGRVFFVRVPLFQRFLPTDKNPQGAIASLYFNFFLALGVSKEDVAKGKLPSLEELGGKRVGFQMKVQEPDQWHDDKWNEVANVFAPQALDGVAEPGQSPVASAFQPQAGAASPWGTQSDSSLQAAADSGAKAF